MTVHCHFKGWNWGGNSCPGVGFPTLKVVQGYAGGSVHLRVDIRALRWDCTPNWCNVTEIGGVFHRFVYLSTRNAVNAADLLIRVPASKL